MAKRPSAIGFVREAGTGRGYVNVSNPNLPIGTRLARRQYDKLAEAANIRRTAEEIGEDHPGWEGAQQRGQRRFNTALEAYAAEQRRLGRKVDRRKLKSSPEFKAILADLKGMPNKRGNPAIADENRFNRRKALDRLGGDKVFRDQYESLYGGRPGGHGFRRPATRSGGRPLSRGGR